MAKRNLQELYDDFRKTQEDIEDLEDQLSELKDDQKKRQKKIDWSLDIDYVSQKKLVWQDMTKSEWKKDKKCNEVFWVYKSDDLGEITGIWKGLKALKGVELEHWEDYKEDYFYYGHPNYVDVNAGNVELSERELAFESNHTLEYYEK